MLIGSYCGKIFHDQIFRQVIWLASKVVGHSLLPRIFDRLLDWQEAHLLFLMNPLQELAFFPCLTCKVNISNLLKLRKLGRRRSHRY